MASEGTVTDGPGKKTNEENPPAREADGIIEKESTEGEGTQTSGDSNPRFTFVSSPARKGKSEEDQRRLKSFKDKFQHMFEGGVMEAEDYNADVVVWRSREEKGAKDRFVPRPKVQQYFLEHLVEVYRGLCTQIIHDLKQGIPLTPEQHRVFRYNLPTVHKIVDPISRHQVPLILLSRFMTVHNKTLL